LVFLALVANLFRPVIFPRRACAEEPYQVAVLKTEFRYVVNKLEERVQALEKKFEKHTHQVDIYRCKDDAEKVKVKTSKPQ
jgi:hypothetical protein